MSDGDGNSDCDGDAVARGLGLGPTDEVGGTVLVAVAVAAGVGGCEAAGALGEGTIDALHAAAATIATSKNTVPRITQSDVWPGRFVAPGDSRLCLPMSARLT